MPGLSRTAQLSLIHGDSPFLIDRAARQLIGDILGDGDPGYALTVVDLEESPVSDAEGHLQTGSLIADTRVVWLRNVNQAKAPDQKRLVGACGGLPPGTFVVMTAATTRQRAQKGLPVSAALGKLVEKSGQTACFMTPYERELAGWVADEAGKMGKSIDRGAAVKLVEMVGRDHGRLHSEVAKLAAYVGEADRIDPQAVSQVACSSAEASSFDLVDAIAEGNVRRALAMAADLVPAHNPTSAAIPLLGMIARHLRLIWQASFLAGKGAPVGGGGRVDPELAALLPQDQNVLQAARTTFVARKLAAHARNLTDGQVALALERVLHADRSLKGQAEEHLDPRLVVERLVTELCLLSGSGARTRGSP